MMRQLLKDSRGGVHILGAFSLVAVIGAMGFGVDMTAAYSAKIRNQRVSDMAALTAAQVMNDTGDVDTAEAAALATARAAGLPNPRVATQSSIESGADCPREGEGEAVCVTVTTNEGVYFARIFGVGSSVAVAANSKARFGEITPPCVVALSSTATGVVATGGTRLTATDCAVASNSSISADGGARLTAQSFSAPAGTRKSGGASIITVPEPGQINSAKVNDPICGGDGAENMEVDRCDNESLKDAFNLLGTYKNVETRSVAAGTDFNLNGQWSGNYSHSGYSRKSWSNSTYTFPAGTYTIKDLTVAGGMRLVFEGPSNITISGQIKSVGAGLTIESGNLTVVGLSKFEGGSPVTIGPGRHYFGPMQVTTSGTVSIGDGDLDINGKLAVGGGSDVRFGDGNITVGNTSGQAISVGGGADLSFGDGEFSANGSISSDGGSSITFGAASEHFVNGDMNLSGASNFGEGRYVVDGSLTNRTGQPMAGQDVSFILAGSVNLAGGAELDLAAPDLTGDAAIQNLLFASLTSNDVSLAAGSAAKLAGAAYFPNAGFIMSGGAEASGGGQCFMLIAKAIRLNGGAAGATACPGIGSSTSGSLVALIR